MNAIVVVDKNWAIGKEGGLLMHLPGDLKYFKEKTEGKNIVIGRKTLESFPGAKPLPNRNNIVLTGNREFENENCDVCYSMAQLMMTIGKLPKEEVFIAGGQQIYKEMLEFCDTFYVTHIEKEFLNADKFFPDLTKENVEETWRSDTVEEKGVRYYFAKYERK